jgi:hypothetical protein
MLLCNVHVIDTLFQLGISRQNERRRPVRSFSNLRKEASIDGPWSVVRVLGYRSGGPSSIPGTTRKKNVLGLERGPLSLVSTIEELLDKKVAAPV